MIKEAISKIVEGENLEEKEAIEVMNEIMNGEATPAQISAFLTALRLKGETIEEITGCAKVMREKSKKIKIKKEIIVDTCGTGGDGTHTFNISTISAFVVAGAGLTVAKHGNRSVSSKCGSADLLESLGVKIEVAVEQVKRCLEEIGIGFLFAPLFHGAMKYAIGPRKEIGIRTIFNILGPLTNPVNANVQVLGVYNPELTELMAGVLKNLGLKHAFVVCGLDGLDEISLTGETKVSELKAGEIKTYFVKPTDFGFNTSQIEEFKGGDVAQNAKIALDILNGKKSPKRDVVVLNAAFALVAGEMVKNIREGIKIAENSLDAKKALRKLELLEEYTNED